MSIPEFLDKNFIGRDPLKESVLGCTAGATTRVLQLRDALAVHTHADLDEILYIVAGDGVVRVRDETMMLAPGSLTVIPRGLPHATERRGRNPLIVLSTLAGAACPAASSGRVERWPQVITVSRATLWDRSGMSVDSGSRQARPIVTAYYAVALVLCAIAPFLQYLLQPIIGERFPFAVFPAAIVAAAWSGALGPGLVATVAAALITDYFFLKPVHSLWISDPVDALALALFVLAAVVVSLRTRDLRRRAGLERQVRTETARELGHTTSLQELTAALLRAEGERDVIHVGLTELLHCFAATAGAVVLADHDEPRV